VAEEVRRGVGARMKVFMAGATTKGRSMQRGP
jgi:hypothetical protein